MSNLPKMWVNGQDLKGLGVQVLKLPDIQSAEPRVKRIEIPGRSGYLTIPTDAWEETEQPAELLYRGNDPQLIARTLRAVTSVRFSNDPDYIYDCAVLDAIRLQKVTKDVYKTTVIFRCGLKRMRYPELKSGTSIILENETDTISLPRISLAASGTVSIQFGAETLTVTGAAGTLVIDSMLGLVYDGNGNAWNRFTGSLPELRPGETVTVTSAASMTIDPQWRWS